MLCQLTCYCWLQASSLIRELPTLWSHRESVMMHCASWMTLWHCCALFIWFRKLGGKNLSTFLLFEMRQNCHIMLTASPLPKLNVEDAWARNSKNFSRLAGPSRIKDCNSTVTVVDGSVTVWKNFYSFGLCSQCYWAMCYCPKFRAIAYSPVTLTAETIKTFPDCNRTISWSLSFSLCSPVKLKSIVMHHNMHMMEVSIILLLNFIISRSEFNSLIVKPNPRHQQWNDLSKQKNLVDNQTSEGQGERAQPEAGSRWAWGGPVHCCWKFSVRVHSWPTADS